MQIKGLIFLFTMVLFLLSARPQLFKYSTSFWGSFDTITTIYGYAKTKKEFEQYTALAIDSLSKLNRYYDRFNEYEDIFNVATINSKGYLQNIIVDEPLFSLLEYGVAAEERTNGAVDLKIGLVSEVWRKEILLGSGKGVPPEYEKLKTIAEKYYGGEILLNAKNKAVHLTKEDVQLEVGAFAKGYAVEQVALMLAKSGMGRVAVSSGGNIRACLPPDGKIGWEVGIQDPDLALLKKEAEIVKLTINSFAISTSGDYQRGFWHDNTWYHHIIDPHTLYPASKFRAVTVVCQNAADADLFSTALFILDLEEGKKIAEKESLAVVWMLKDGRIVANEKMAKLCPKDFSFIIL